MPREYALMRLLCLLAWTAWASAQVVYVVDLTVFSYLAPCAQTALSLAVGYQTHNGLCPFGGTELQECICTSRTDAVSASVSADVSELCTGTATSSWAMEEYSALSVFDVYCNQIEETSFDVTATPTSTVPLAEDYIYELPDFKDLAPCASRTLSALIQSNTLNECPSEPTALASCLCNDESLSANVSQSINKAVSAQCHNTADVSSAQAIFSAYCGIESGVTSLPTPTNPPGNMTYYITDIPQYKVLETCARVAVRSAVQHQTLSLCPTNGPEALASCVCLKPNVSDYVTSTLSSAAKSLCYGNWEGDYDAATAVIDRYCSAAKGEITESVNTATPTPSYVSYPEGYQDYHTGPSKGVIAGATVGSIAAVSIIAVAAWFLLKRRRQKKAIPKSIPMEIMVRNDEGYKYDMTVKDLTESTSVVGQPSAGPPANPPSYETSRSSRDPA